MVNLIAALTKKDRVIGKDNKLPWILRNDLKRFRDITMGHPVIMGRKSYEAIGHALKGRTNFVLSRNTKLSIKDATVCSSIEEAISLAIKLDDQIFIIGGEHIFSEAILKKLIDRMYLTYIDREFSGDAFFPEFNFNEWKKVSNEGIVDNGINTEFVIFDKINQ